MLRAPASLWVFLFLLVFALPSFAQGPELLREAFSREYSIDVGGEQMPLVKDIASREVSIFIGAEPASPYAQAISREVSFVVTTLAVPARVTQLNVAVSPTGDRATLDWCGYNEIAQSDVVRYRIYISTAPFITVSNLSPSFIAPAGTCSLTISNLAEYQDRYFAVVAEDALGGSDPVVDYSAAYVVAPQAISREVSLFVGGEPTPPYAQVISREVSLLMTTPAPPQRVTQLNVSPSPTGDRATLEWCGYNEIVQHDVVRYDIYASTTVFTNLSGLTPYASVPAGACSLMLSNLAEFQDRYFAVVAVDALGGYEPLIEYSAAYVLAPQAITREYSLFVGGEPASPYAQAVSREISILVPDNTIPDPVTGLGTGFDAVTSVSAFSAIDANWSSYNELKQRDVVRYRVYLGPSFFTDVSSMEPYEFVPAGTQRHTIRGLFCGNIYYVAVVAEDVLGNFNPTVRSVSAKASICSLGEVRNLAVVSSSNSLRFNWLAPAEIDAFLTGYRVYFGGATNPVTLPANATSYEASGLQPATAYPFRISTVDTFNSGSAGVSLLAATWLAHPANVTALGFDSMVRLTWTHAEPNDLVKHYAVYRSTSPFASVVGLTPVLTTRATRADVTGLVNGTPAYFAVTTVNISDGEQPAVQTVAATPNAVSGTFADLWITNLAAPATVFSGQTITLQWSVRNAGAGATSDRNGAAVAAWTDQVALSPDLVIGDADDVILTNASHAGGLAAGSGYVGNVAVQLPTNYLGQYYLFVLVNSRGDVYEHLDSAANLIAQPVFIGPPAPPVITQQPVDRIGFEGRTASFSVVADGSPPLSYHWRRDGEVLPAYTNATLVLSNLQLSDAGDYLVTIANIAGSTNSRNARLTVYPPPPDLFAPSLVSPTNLIAGQPVTVSWITTNGGVSSATPPWKETLLLANNSAGSNATALYTFNSSTPLAPGSSVTRSPTVIIPSTFSGNHWLVVHVDSGDQVAEDDGETNNVIVATSPVVITSPDLEITLLTAPATGVFGQPVNVTWMVKNVGTGSTFVNWNDAIFLSLVSGAVTGATTLDSAPSRGTLAPGQSYTNTLSVTPPLNSSFPTGTYYFVLQADANNVQPEANEANNLASRAVSLTLPPLPDLVAVNVSSLSNASPGQTIAVSWAITNQGPAIATGPWTETLRIVADEVTRLTNSAEVQSLLASAATLGTFAYSNTLASGESLTRTQFVTLPGSGVSGDTRLVVTVDGRDEVLEENETNNVAFAGDILHIPLKLSLQLSAAQISEDSTMAVRATLTRNGNLAQALSVTVSVSDTNELRAAPPAIPSPGVEGQRYTITIPANQHSIAFDLHPVRDHIVDPNKLVTLGASAPGYDSASAVVTVLNSDLPTLALAPASNSVAEGASMVMTVTRSLVTSNALAVALSSSSPGQLSPPNFVTIPAGVASTNFLVLAVDDVNAEASATYSISANAAGFNGGSATVTVLDNDVPQLAVTLSAHSVSEGAGPQALSMTVTRNPVGAGSLNIEPTTDDASLVNLPLRITIPAGQASRSFPVGVIDDGLDNGSRTVALGAYALATGSGARLGEAVPDLLTVTDDDGPTLKLTAALKLVREGLNPATTLTATRNTPATNELLLTLTSSRTNEATVPATVTMGVGAVSVTFPLTSHFDGTNDGNQPAQITASAVGFTDGVEMVVVSDTDLPDLVVSNLGAPASAVPQQRVPITYRVANQGLSASSGAFLTRVYLSRDATVGDDVLVAQFQNTGGLSVSNYFESTEQIQLPLEVGNYWVVVETDAEQVLAEVLEDNNTRISDAPIAVSADYAAWVQTDITNAPAGTPVQLYGRATNSLGAGAASRPVNIRVRVRGTERVLSATTDGGGNFTATFTPLPGEAGFYEILATHPGVKDAPVQDTFKLLGFRANPASVSLTIIEGTTRTGTVSLENLSDVPLAGLSVEVVSKPASLTVAADVSPLTLQGSGKCALNYSFTATTTDAHGTVVLRVVSSEGASNNVTFAVSVEPLRPRLVARPVSLYSAMLRGGQAMVEFDVANLGGKESGPITISLPSVPWMHLATTNPMPSLAPGQTNRVTLLLQPTTNVALGPYTGSLAINADGGGTTVPFDFRAVSEALGDLRVEAVDEFAYYAEGSPRLAGATVTVRDAYTRSNIVSGVTGTNGIFATNNLNEGYYEIEVTADKHTTYRATHLLKAGITNEVQTFLSRQTVTYTWTVEPVEIEDRYKITIDTTFETVVPIPVVTIEPSVIDLAEITADETHIDIKITNHGLIAANNTRLSFPVHPLWRFSPLIDRVGTLAARSSITVPVTIRRFAPVAGNAMRFVSAAAMPDSGPCYTSATVCWDLLCGATNTYCANVLIANTRSGCGGNGPAPTPTGGCVGCGGGPDGGGGGTYTGPGFLSLPNLCDCSWLRNRCATIPEGVGFDLSGLLGKVVAKLNEARKKFPVGVFVEDPEFSITPSGSVCICCEEGRLGLKTNLKVTGASKLKAFLGAQFKTPDSWKSSGEDDVRILSIELKGNIEGISLTGDVSGTATLKKECFEDAKVCAFGEAGLTVGHGYEASGAITLNVGGIMMGGSAKASASMNGRIWAHGRYCDGDYKLGACEQMKIGWGALEASVVDPRTGATKTFTFVPEGGLEDDVYCVGDPPPGFDYTPTASAAGLANGQSPEDDLDSLLIPDEAIFRMLDVPLGRENGVCAHVKLRLEQDAVLTRDAFRAMLELENHGNSRLENVRVAVDIRDEAGNVATNFFGERFEGATVLSAVDGTGILAGNSTGAAKWLLIPTVDAAPQVATRYLVGGTLSYRLDGNNVTVNMTPVPITVLPSPRLTLQYFHQRDVFSDDPFTDVIEPAIPYSLAVMVQNRGYGDAKNFHITSAQPKIIENEKGLLIDFNIIATETFTAGGVSNPPPSLTANFGNISAGDTAIGRWLLTSTLQGLFIDYSAKFEHIDGLGNPRLSLIDEVTIHEMNHLVQAGGIWEDGKPDFLVNQIPDVRDLPDTLYQSNGSTNPVVVVEQASVGSSRVDLQACKLEYSIVSPK